MRSRRLLIPFLLVAGIGFAPAGANAAGSDPAALVNELISHGLATLHDSSLSQTARQQRFAALLKENFDIPRIARYVLGRYWLSASDAERQAFSQLFQQWVIRTYSTRLGDFRGDGIKVTGSRPESDSGAVVTTQIVRADAPPINLEWRVHRDDSGYKIVDVDVEGVSMALTEREEVASVIQRNGGTVAGLNHALEQRIASEDSQAAAH